MAEDKTGGPAFPIPYGFSVEQGMISCDVGMTLRDWFAGQAMQGVLSSLAPGEWMSYGDASEHAYRFADAMIRERNK